MMMLRRLGHAGREILLSSSRRRVIVTPAPFLAGSADRITRCYHVPSELGNRHYPAELEPRDGELVYDGWDWGIEDAAGSKCEIVDAASKYEIVDAGSDDEIVDAGSDEDTENN